MNDETARINWNLVDLALELANVTDAGGNRHVERHNIMLQIIAYVEYHRNDIERIVNDGAL